ncbi:MAG: isoprenyl transferase [Deltaproteobacteria bacterium]|nr:isoprenyl transferase [Deltaproteobacteria bacterium]
MQILDPEKLPRHLAIIMDGNGRWAQERMLKRIVGHRKGVETVKTIVEESSLLGIKYLTLFAFSSENWLRPKTEVRALMALLKAYLAKETSRMMTNNVRFAVIGDRSDLPGDVNKAVSEAIDKTAQNTGMVLTLALSYGSHQEIIQAVSLLVDDVLTGKVPREKISEQLMSSYLYTREIPDPDFLIRTSGEMRISNFLLWQIAYTELYFTEVNWPDFSKEEFYNALANYQARERRYGLISDQVRKRG